MEQLTFGACVKKSWESTWQAVVRMPVLLLGTCIVFTCITLLSGSYQHTPGETAQLGAATAAGHALIRMVLSILNFVVTAALTIKIHRFVLLGEGSQPLMPLGGKPLGRHALLSLGLALVAALVAMVGVVLVVTTKLASMSFILVPVCLVCFYVFVRLGLLYPALSLGAPISLRAAWNDSRGHFWSMWRVGFVVTLPLWIVAVVGIIFSALRRPHVPGSHGQTSPSYAIGMALVGTLFVVLAGAASAWLYQRYAKQLRNEVGPGAKSIEL
jgi:hypothetical protein